MQNSRVALDAKYKGESREEKVEPAKRLIKEAIRNYLRVVVACSFDCEPGSGPGGELE